MTAIRISLVAACLLSPGWVQAQDLVFSPAATEACLSVSSNPADCIGASANACMSDTPGGDTTVGMGGCLDRERAYWDDRLNAVYRDLMASEAADDAAYGGPGVLKKADALRQMQRAWIPYRDATCDYERSQWGGGTGGGPATVGCLMQLTGEQALYLQGVLEGF